MSFRTGETCATLKCEEECCSHSNGYLFDDHCCSKDEYEAHKKEEENNSHYPVNGNGNYSDVNAGLYPYNYKPDNNPNGHDKRFDPNRLDPFTLLTCLLVVGITTAVLLLAVFGALRYRRKYMKFKKEHVVVRHNVEGEEISIEAPCHMPLTTNDSSVATSSQTFIISEKQRQPSSEPEAPTITPPPYNDLYAKDSSGTSNINDSGTSNQK